MELSYLYSHESPNGIGGTLVAWEATLVPYGDCFELIFLFATSSDLLATTLIIQLQALNVSHHILGTCHLDDTIVHLTSS